MISIFCLLKLGEGNALAAFLSIPPKNHYFDSISNAAATFDGESRSSTCSNLANSYKLSV